MQVVITETQLIIIGAVVGVVAILALLVAAYAWHEFAKVRRMYHVFMTGVDKGNLEQGLLGLAARIENLTSDSQIQGKELRELERRLSFAIQRVGMVKFNAFNDVGGEMSFAIALLDAAGSGIVVSSIYGRAEARVYAKSVEKRVATSALSAEESKAIDEAMQTRK